MRKHILILILVPVSLFSYSQDYYDGQKTEIDSCMYDKYNFTVGASIEFGEIKEKKYKHIRVREKDYLGRGYAGAKLYVDHIRMNTANECYPVFYVKISDAFRMLVYVDLDKAIRSQEVILNEDE